MHGIEAAAWISYGQIPAATNAEVGLPASCYFPVGDVSALTEHLSGLLTGDTPARVTYDLSKYNWDNIAGQVAAVYDALAAR